MACLLDTTLREGEQTVGINFSIDQKKTIIDGLALVGVSELEIGTVSPLSGDLPEITSYCRHSHPSLRVSFWCRCKDDDILYAAALSPDCLSLSIPVSDLHLTKKLGKDRAWAEQTMVSAIRLARANGLAVSIGFEDATRADPVLMARMASLAEHAGAFRIRLADTVGIATPLQFTTLVETVKKATSSCELAVHTHNDFGMATANALTALESGARWVDVTVLGLGERSGCARLEEVAGYLGIMGSQTQFRVEHLKPLAEYVAKIIEKNIDDCRPMLGEKIFACETGLHLFGLQRDHTTYEPFPPELIGASRHLLYGAKCGRKALQKRLADLGHEIDDGRLLQTTLSFRKKALVSGKSLDDKEIFDAMTRV